VIDELSGKAADLTILAARIPPDPASVHVVAAGTVAVSDLSFWYNLLTIAGVAGLWVVAFLFDWIVTRRVYDKAVADGLEWKRLYEHERDAHAATRTALELAGQRADAGVEAAKVTKALIDGLRSADRPGAIGA
jgi:hypothetical protein